MTRVEQILKEKQKLEAAYLKKLEMYKAFKEHNACFFFKPYKWQDRFFDMVRRKNVTVVASPNKIGKCLSYQTLIDTSLGSIKLGDLFESGKDFMIYAWNGENKVLTKALPPFKKEGLHQCYKIVMSDGRVLEAADGHLVLLRSGEYRSVGKLYEQFLFQRDSNLELSRSTHVLDADHLSQRQLDYQEYYSEDFRQYDEQLLSCQENGLTPVPSQADAQLHTCHLSHSDDLAYTDTYSPFLLSSHLSSLYVPLHYEGRFSESLTCNADKYALLSSEKLLESLQSSTAVAFSPPQDCELHAQISRHLSDPFVSPFYISTNKIVSIIPIGMQEVYDFTVPEFHNYCTAGMIHHNSASTVNLAISWAMGFDPWHEVPEGTENAVKYRNNWYRQSSLGIKPPVKLRITGEDWRHHLGQVIVPELKKWAPAGAYETRKNEQGIEFLWTWENGSTYELLSYTQESEISEAWMGHGWVADEPPPKSMYGSMSRGIFLNNGKVVIDMTPLKEVWVLDDLILSGRTDIGIINDLLITANEDLYNDEVGKLTELGLNAEQIAMYFDVLLYKNKDREEFVDDKGRAARRFIISNMQPIKEPMIDELKLLRFVQDTDPDEAPSRFGGRFKALVGRVLRSWRQDVHWIEPFKVPTDWPVIAMIDFHLNKPHAISFHAVNRQGIHFIIHEIWENMSSEEVADAIIRYVASNALWCSRAQIDPLSKGDTSYMKNRMGSEIRDSFSIIQERLDEHGIELEVASKDKVSGIKNIEAELRGVNYIPTYYVFNDCPRHLYEIQRWVYDDDGKPAKEYDDMMENWYRATLSGLEWDEKPKAREHQPYVPTSHAWMGA